MTLTAQAHRPATASLPAVSRVGQRRAVPLAAGAVGAGGRRLTHFVWFVFVLTVVGAVLAAQQLATMLTTAGPSPRPVLQTPYGLVAVGDVTVSAAVDASKGMVGKGHAAHAGAASGPAGVRVNVPVTLQNTSDAAVRYAPEQFRLVTSNGRPTGPVDSALLTGQLRPGAAVALRLTFALPAAATSTRLVVAGGQPAAGLDLQLPGASTPGRQMTPQEQPVTHEKPAQPAEPAQPARPAEHSTSDDHRH